MAPRWYLQRLRARLTADLAVRHYEAASAGRRTQGWRSTTADANEALAGGIDRLRALAQDLVRNNPYADSAVSTIVDHAVGWGIRSASQPDAWRKWTESTDCDADGMHDFYGLQQLVMRTVAVGGECLVRRRLRYPSDGLALPLQLQILEPDYLDTQKDAGVLPNGGRILQGIEFDALGRRTAYWLFREHPGARWAGGNASQRVPAEGVLHIGRVQRPGQVRFVTWFASMFLTFKDFDELEDATLMKQKVAACLAVITTDTDGTAQPLGTVDAAQPGVDTLSPGGILNIPSGRSVEVVQPPSVREYNDYARTQLRKIATGLGITYEDLTGDYTDMNFSSARMSLIRHWLRVEGWRWRMLVPQFLDPVWAWAQQAGAIVGKNLPERTEWSMPAMPMVDPDKEGLAAMRNVRAGVQTLSQVIRERGYNPKQFLDELQRDFEDLDTRGLVLDVDPRRMTQAGQAQQVPGAPQSPEDAAAPQRMVALLESLGARLDRRSELPPQVNVDARTTVAAQPPPEVHVDARSTISVPAAPAPEVRFDKGAIQASVHLPPAAAARKTIVLTKKNGETTGAVIEGADQ